MSVLEIRSLTNFVVIAKILFTQPQTKRASRSLLEVYSEPCKTFKIERFTDIVNG